MQTVKREPKLRRGTPLHGDALTWWTFADLYGPGPRKAHSSSTVVAVRMNRPGCPVTPSGAPSYAETVCHVLKGVVEAIGPSLYREPGVLEQLRVSGD